ncbi:hypothetical protein F5Y10DRAFT_294372 [Nemania abortiva]|nr:hypothetical protein F5Y10DRAFT_294372 [Nemania abortiva]
MAILAVLSFLGVMTSLKPVAASTATGGPIDRQMGSSNTYSLYFDNVQGYAVELSIGTPPQTFNFSLSKSFQTFTPTNDSYYHGELSSTFWNVTRPVEAGSPIPASLEGKFYDYVVLEDQSTFNLSMETPTSSGFGILGLGAPNSEWNQMNQQAGLNSFLAQLALNSLAVTPVYSIGFYDVLEQPAGELRLGAIDTSRYHEPLTEIDLFFVNYGGNSTNQINLRYSHNQYMRLTSITASSPTEKDVIYSSQETLVSLELDWVYSVIAPELAIAMWEIAGATYALDRTAVTPYLYHAL